MDTGCADDVVGWKERFSVQTAHTRSLSSVRTYCYSKHSSARGTATEPWCRLETATTLRRLYDGKNTSTHKLLLLGISLPARSAGETRSVSKPAIRRAWPAYYAANSNYNPLNRNVVHFRISNCF